MDSDMKQFDYCNSETSTEETDHQSGKSSDEFSGARFYECTFCKRGFTNAQALGGHMNIHRKEKAKNKPKKAAKKGSLISSKTQEDHEYRSNYSSHAIESQYYQMNNYQFYYPPENPSLPIAYHNMINDFAAAHRSSDHHMGYYEDHHRISNLSLSIDGGSSNELTDGSMTWNENEIDLELRL